MITMKRIGNKRFLMSLFAIIMLSGLIMMPMVEVYANDWVDLGENVGKITATNWMAGLSGQRKLHEINIPGTHDTGMKDVFNLSKNGLISLGSSGAKTQKLFIPEQLNAGIRMFDIRITDQFPFEEGAGENDLFIVHGPIYDLADLSFYSKVDDNRILMFHNVMDYFCTFLEQHPTETLIVSITPESHNANRSVTYQRAKNIIDKCGEKKNSKTGKSFIYTDNGSKQYKMPLLMDTRGQIVFISDSPDSLGYGMKFDTSNGTGTHDIGGIPFDYENHYEANDEDKEYYIKVFYNEHKTGMSSVNDKHLERGIYVNTSSNQAKKAKVWQLPAAIAEYINPIFFTNSDAYFKTHKGLYFGWIGSDFVDADTAKTVWMSNYASDPKCNTKVTFRPSSDSAADINGKEPIVFERLDSSTEVLPVCTFSMGDKVQFAGWKLEPKEGETDESTDKIYKPGDKVWLTRDMVFTAQWRMSWKSFKSLVQKGGTTEIKLESDIAADPNDSEILVKPNANVHINLNGHTIEGIAEDTLSPRSSFCVYDRGSLTITGPGTIKGGTGITGGAFNVEAGGTLVLDNVKVTGNAAKSNGGAIYLASSLSKSASLTLKDTEITGNTAGSSGGGIYKDDRADITLTGKVTVTDNKTEAGTTDNLCLNNINDDHRIRFGEGFSRDSKIGICVAPGLSGGQLVFTDGFQNTSANQGVFSSDDTRYNIIIVRERRREAALSGYNRQRSTVTMQVRSGQGTSMPAEQTADQVEILARLLAQEEPVDWTPDESNTVTFITVGLTDPFSQSVEYGGFAVNPEIYPEDNPQLTIPANKISRGWYELVPGISPSELEELLEEYYIPDDMFWVDGDDVLMAFEFDYPIFTDTELRLKLEDKMCTVNIIDDGDIVDMIFTPYGEAMKEAEALPWVLGYDFTGWYDDADCKKLHDFSKPVLEDFSLFAGWKRTQRKITFDSSGGDSVKTQTILSGDKARKPASPTKKGFEFAGWYENVMSNVSESDFKEFFEAFPEAKNQITFAGGNAYLPYDFNNEVYTNHTLTAFWNSKQTPSQSPLKSVMKAKGKKVKVKVGKARKLKKKKTIAAKKAYKITGSAGKLTFKKVNKAGKNKILVNTSTGKITLKKGLKKKTYKVKVRIKDSGNKKYASAKKTVTVKIIMKK